MLARQTETPPVNALTLENIQKQLESATVEPFGYPLQWSSRQNVAQALSETIRQINQTQARLTPEQSQKAAVHLAASIDALKTLESAKPKGMAMPEQQTCFDQAWENLEQARLSLCINAYERLRPSIGIIKDGPPDLSSRPYMIKHGLWPKEEQC